MASALYQDIGVTCGLHPKGVTAGGGAAVNITVLDDQQKWRPTYPAKDRAIQNICLAPELGICPGQEMLSEPCFK